MTHFIDLDHSHRILVSWSDADYSASGQDQSVLALKPVFLYNIDITYGIILESKQSYVLDDDINGVISDNVMNIKAFYSVEREIFEREKKDSLLPENV